MYVQADAKQLEWRTILLLSGDPTGIDEINKGEDTHENNRVAFSLPDRGIAKIYLFRTIFRGSGWAFANDNAFSHVSDDPDYWDDINRMFFTKYSRIDACHREWFKAVAARRPIVGPTGSRWYPPLDKYGGVDEPAAANYPVQGTGADIVATARVAIWREIRRRGKSNEWLLCNTVHDSIVIDCPKDDVQEVANMMYEVFDKLPEILYNRFKWKVAIPLPAECKVGPNLLEMKDIEYGYNRN